MAEKGNVITVKLMLIGLQLLAMQTVSAQGWQQIGDFNSGTRYMYTDTSDNLLYVTTQAAFNGADTIKGMFYYDGTTIYPLGYSRNGSGNSFGPVPLIQKYQGKMLFGGAIDKIGNVEVNAIAVWDGQEWGKIDGLYNAPHPTDTSGTADCAIVKDDSLLYVSGLFLKAGADTCYSIAYWNGLSWRGVRFFPIYNGDPWRVSRMAFYKGQLYVTGSFLVPLDGNMERDIAVHDGVNWHSVGGGMYGGWTSIYDMQVYKDELYICGYFTAADGNAGNMIMRWNGTEWRDVGGGFCGQSIVSDMVIYQDKLYMAGLFSCVGNGLPANSIAVWDGERWCTFGDNQVFDNKISCLSFLNDDLYVGGGFTQIGNETIKYFAKYTGPLDEITCTAVPVNDLEKAGGLVEVYPNPAGDVVDVSWADLAVSALRLVSADGRCVREMYVAASNRASIDLTGFPPGIYSLQLQLPDGLWTGKVVVARY
jgi:Secretion system C-terminal sorting domain